MAGLTLTAANGVLKDDYIPRVREQLNNSFMLLDQVEKNTEDTYGQAAVLSAHVKRSSGVGARAEGGTLPTAGNQSYAEERVTLKYNYGRGQVSGQTIHLMAKDRGAYVRAVESETKGIVRDLKRYVNTQCYTPASGSIGTTTAGPGATTVAVDSLTTLRRMEYGGLYDIVEASTDVVVRTIQLTSYVESTLTITYTTVSVGAGTGASGNRIVRSGVVPSGNYELTGLETIVDSAGSLFNIDPATHAVWASYEEAVSAAPTDAVFEKALDNVQISSGEDPNLIITSYEAVRTYAASLKTLKRFDNGSLKLKGGWSATSVTSGRNELAMVAERDCNTQTAFLLSTGDLVEFVASDWEFMDNDGAVLSRVSSADAYEFVVYRYHELACSRRNSHAKLTSLTVS